MGGPGSGAKPKPETQLRKLPFIQMHIDGMTYNAIAKQLGVSRQRIHQLLSPTKEQRHRTMERAGFCCEHCQVPIGETGHIHHQKRKDIALAQYNEPENLQYLCAICHRLQHVYGEDAPTRVPLTYTRIEDLPPSFIECVLSIPGSEIIEINSPHIFVKWRCVIRGCEWISAIAPEDLACYEPQGACRWCGSTAWAKPERAEWAMAHMRGINGQREGC